MENIKLSNAEEGKKLKITGLKSGKRMESRLIELGLPIGSELIILQKQKSGPIVVAAGDARLGIGAGMASKILVVEI